jgi:glutathione S-transferase
MQGLQTHDGGMKLYYTPSTCSLAAHIALREARLPFELVRVDLRTKRAETGEDLHQINPNGYVPVLQLEDGRRLTEAAVLLQLIAEAVPDAKLAPATGTPEHVRFRQLLTYIATELAKGFAVFTLMPNPSEEIRRWATSRLESRVAFLADELRTPYLMGDTFMAVDAYAFWALRSYTQLTKMPLPDPLRAYIDRVGSRPAVLAALAAEGSSRNP